MGGRTVAGYGAIGEMATSPGLVTIFADNIRPWLRAFFSLSLATNLLATGASCVLLRVIALAGN